MVDPISRQLYRRSVLHGPLILMYHAVSPGSSTPLWPWAVSMARFTEQLDFLDSEGWKTVTIKELVANPHTLPSRTLAITFDDGYRDNVEACTEVAKRNMCASVFVVSGSIGDTPSWSSTGRPAIRMLGAAELRDLDSAGMEIGSHSRSHQELTKLAPLERLEELTSSKRRIEDILSAEITSFAYPYGTWDEGCEHAVRSAGYGCACTTQTGWALRDHNPFRLRRLTILNDDNVGRFARKLALAANDVGWATMLRYFAQRGNRALLSGKLKR